MLSLLKRKSDVPAGPVVPAWHPNFRDYEKLPDVKVVRTAFFVNAGAIVVVLALGLYFGIHELQLRGLNSQIETAQQEIDRDKKHSDMAVAQFRKFQAEQAKADEVDAFVKARPVVSDFVLRIARTRPENIAIDGIEMRANGVALRMTVRGTPETAAGYATEYFNQLKSDKELTAFDPARIEFTNQARNPSTGNLAVEFFLRFTEQYTEKKKP